MGRAKFINTIIFVIVIVALFLIHEYSYRDGYDNGFYDGQKVGYDNGRSAGYQQAKDDFGPSE